ncbi:MAG: type II toxin-antitoxin system HicB family antitoxin [Flavobacteriaceae bacterium]
MTFTALIEKSDDGWYVGQLEELPEVLSQGKDVEELKSNLLDALSVFLASNRESVAQNHQGKEIIRESLQMK